MNCMKCGRDVALGQVFCKECLADMAKYPVQPGTPVILPNRSTTVQPRRVPSRKARKPEEQINTLRKVILWLSIAVIAIALAFGITTSILLNKLDECDNNRQHGQNYSTEAANVYEWNVSRETPAL